MALKETFHQCRLRLFDSIRKLDALNSELTKTQEHELNAEQIDNLKKAQVQVICVGADLQGILEPYVTDETVPELDAKLPE